MGIMKTKNLLIFLLFVSATTLTIWLGSIQNSNIKNIVTETHKSINSNLRHFGNLKSAKSLSVDDKYLELLGLLPDHSTHNTLPNHRNYEVIGTAVGTSNEREILPKFVKHINKYLQPKKLIVFTIDLSDSKILKLKKFCNSSSCNLKKFPLDQLPSHLDNLDIKAYKAVAIQLLLKTYPVVMWTDITKDIPIKIQWNKTKKQVQKTGVLAWPIRDPISAFTHPKMFKFFDSNPEDYHFIHMVKTDHILVHNTQFIRERVMLPWVQCSLTEECIAPLGAQAGGCYVPKPWYKYRGCHKFEMSALNLALGSAFQRDSTHYVVNDRLFMNWELFAEKKSTLSVNSPINST